MGPYTPAGIFSKIDEDIELREHFKIDDPEDHSTGTG